MSEAAVSHEQTFEGKTTDNVNDSLQIDAPKEVIVNSVEIDVYENPEKSESSYSVRKRRKRRRKRPTTDFLVDIFSFLREFWLMFYF